MNKALFFFVTSIVFFFFNFLLRNPSYDNYEHKRIVSYFIFRSEVVHIHTFRLYIFIYTEWQSIFIQTELSFKTLG